ncbi:MAG: TraR/DksA C4-type zinc finger protein [Candidatus Latescibacterota bacterium]
MNKNDLSYFEDLIRAKQEYITKDLERFQRVATSGTMAELAGDLSAYPQHLSDQGSDATEREETMQFATKERRYLYHLDQALERTRNGSYGRCSVCGNEIGRERLEAVPHATKCIKCKSDEERTQRNWARSAPSASFSRDDSLSFSEAFSDQGEEMPFGFSTDVEPEMP